MITFSLDHFPRKVENDFFINIIKQTSEKICNIHRHDYTEIMYIYRGEGYNYIDGVEYYVKKGSLLIIPVGATHNFYSNTSMSFYTIGIKSDLESVFAEKEENSELSFALSVLINEFGSLNCVEKKHIKFKEQTMIKIEELAEFIYDEIMQKPLTYELVVVSLLSTILLYVMREENKETSLKSRKYNIDDILNYVSLHYNEKVSLNTLSKEFFFNPSYISRLFKEHNGNTFSNYLQKIRISRACEILVSDNSVAIDDLAAAVGYTSKNLFYNHFKKHMGLTPYKYKIMYKNLPIKLV